MVNKSSGFPLFRYWYDLYGSVSPRPLPSYDKFQTTAKIAFNAKLVILKGNYHFETKDIKALMLYALLHDPLSMGYEAYGNLDNLIKAAKPFVRWRKNYADDLASKYSSELKAIVDTAPQTSNDAIDRDSFQEFAEAFING
jgi:hypothetical protein